MKKLFYTLFTVVLLAGCDANFLDTEPYDAVGSESIWDSDENAERAVNGIYNAFKRPAAFGDFALKYGRLGPAGLAHNGGSIVQGNSNSRTGTYLSTYTDLYRIINFANDAIANLAENPNVSDDLENRLKGEAHFLRGMAYFYLWDLYGGVIILDEPTDPEDTYLPRNTAEEVKQFVIDDFTNAIDLLPITHSDENNGRATEGAAIAMLGKTYLYDEQWANAAEQFSQIMGSAYGYELLEDYDHLFDFKYEDSNNEYIFAIQYVMEPGLGSDYDMRYGGRSTNTAAWNNSVASWNLVDSYTEQDGTPIDMSERPVLSDYPDDYELGLDLIPWYQEAFENADERLHTNVIMPGYTFVGNENEVYMVNWPFSDHANDDIPAYRTNWSDLALFPWRKFVHPGEENQQRWDSPNDLPIIRYADILLMFAEAKNEAEGPSGDVFNAVNQVRDRAGIVDIPSTLSQEELRRAIRMERLRELPGEGHLYFDVRRWETAATEDPYLGLNHDVLDFRGEVLFTRTFDEKDYLWPIPEQEIERNDNLDQNPGW